MLINLLRVFKSSWKSFSRNIWLSVATLFMMFVALFVLSGLILFDESIDVFVSGLENKVDVSAYFKNDTQESYILAVKETLKTRKDVKEVNYISQDKALEIFKERHKNNDVLIDSLKELDSNPLQASLNIRVHDTEKFEDVVSFLENSSSASLIDNINYRENEKVIASISSVASGTRRAGIVFTVLLVVLVIFVTLNTVRIAIYTAREEIYIMKLVGASNWFVRAPFVVTGAMYGLLAAIAVILLSFLATWILHSRVSLVFSEIDFFGYLTSNFFSYFLSIIFAGIVLGTVSSYLAVRRYLKV